MPNFFFFEISFLLFLIFNLSQKISMFRIFHNYTKYLIILNNHKELDYSSRNDSLYVTILGCLIEAKILTSFNAFFLSFSFKLSILTLFKA